MEEQNERNPVGATGENEGTPRQGGYGKRQPYRRPPRAAGSQNSSARGNGGEETAESAGSRQRRDNRAGANRPPRDRGPYRSQGQTVVTRAGGRPWEDASGNTGGGGERPVTANGGRTGDRDNARQGRGRSSGSDRETGQNRSATAANGGGNPRGRGDRRSRQTDARGRERENAGVPESSEQEAPLKENFFVSPDYISRTKLLEDTFSPLHETEVYDPEAEEAAKRILDAEGPLLFREESRETETGEDRVDAGNTAAEMVDIVGVRFKKPGKVYHFAPGELRLSRGTNVIVETARGAEFGEVWIPNAQVPATEIVIPLRPILRVATPEDVRHNEENQEKEQKAFTICQEKIAAHGLDMKLVETQYTFDNSKLLFYFTSDGRVDFRELVKDLASVFRTRIELRQIGIRDEAKLLGGLGACGRPLCCASFLSDFVQVSIKMAKEQNLSLSSTKISGCCGRLMCCLRYEADTYEEEIRRTPTVGTQVKTPEGDGCVVASHPLKGTVDVRLLGQDGDAEVKTFHRDVIQSLRRGDVAEEE